MKTYKFIQAILCGYTAMFLTIALIAQIENDSVLNSSIFLYIVGFMAVMLLVSSIFMALIFPIKTYDNMAHLENIERMYHDSKIRMTKATELITEKISERIIDDVIKEINPNYKAK